MDMRKLLEAVTKFAGEPEQKPGDQVKGTDTAKKGSKEHPFKGRLVGDSKDNMLRGLAQVAEDKSLEWELAEAYAKFMEDDLGVEPKRPARKGSRHARGHEPKSGYTTVKDNEVDEGWESGPEERTSRERDPDAEYDDMRQQRADAEAEKAQARRPQEKYYTLTGRGPNMEPNYAFPGEYATQDEAVAARAKLMADPKTPNPRMIGIDSHTRYLDLKEGIESGDPVESAVLNAVQELIQQGHTEVAPEVITNMVVAATSQPFLLKDLVDVNNNSAAVQHYVDSINPTKVKFSNEILTVKNEDPMKDKQAAQNGVAKMAAKAAGRSRLGEGKVVPVITAFRKGMEKIAASDMNPQAKQAAFDRLSAEFHKNAEAYSQAVKAKRKTNEAGSAVGGGAVGNGASSAGTAALNPDTVKQTTAALNTFKAATGSNAPAPNIAKALDAVTQGTAVGGSEMKILEPVMKDLATVATDPKLASQFKSLAGQVNQTQQKQQQAK